MPEPHDDDLEEQPAPRRRSLIGRLLRAFILVNVAFALISVGIALFLKLTHASLGDEDSDELDLVTIFNGLELKSRATSFRGGTWTIMFGGGDIDLREATLDPDGGTLHVHTIMGGGDVKVPDDWNVELDSLALMGGAAQMRPNATSDPYAPALRIEARAIMGGFSVTGEE